MLFFDFEHFKHTSWNKHMHSIITKKKRKAVEIDVIPQMVRYILVCWQWSFEVGYFVGRNSSWFTCLPSWPFPVVVHDICCFLVISGVVRLFLDTPLAGSCMYESGLLWSEMLSHRVTCQVTSSSVRQPCELALCVYEEEVLLHYMSQILCGVHLL